MAIPGFFKGQPHGRDVLYDGGMVANFAFEEFSSAYPELHTIGMYLYDGADLRRPGDGRLTLFALLGHVFRIYQGQDEVAIVRKHAHRIIRIDTSQEARPTRRSSTSNRRFGQGAEGAEYRNAARALSLCALFAALRQAAETCFLGLCRRPSG
jgi:predicted acylesterase/phospholipase RssA